MMGGKIAGCWEYRMTGWRYDGMMGWRYDGMAV